MNSSEYPAMRPSPRREVQLQGPRPTPLKVSKDSYKIKKPPAAPPAAPYQPSAQPQPPRPPVIIYTVSPKIIHTSPRGFMSLVQRLTGPSSSTDATTSVPSAPSGGLSPAARLATIERTSNSSVSSPSCRNKGVLEDLDQLGIHDAGGSSKLDRSSPHQGILSPMPSSLPSIPPSFFSNTAVAEFNNLSFFQEQQSPAAFHGNRSFVDNTFLISPNNFLSSPAAPSPGAYWDLFNHYQDF